MLAVLAGWVTLVACRISRVMRLSAPRMSSRLFVRSAWYACDRDTVSNELNAARTTTMSRADVMSISTSVMPASPAPRLRALLLGELDDRGRTGFVSGRVVGLDLVVDDAVLAVGGALAEPGHAAQQRVRRAVGARVDVVPDEVCVARRRPRQHDGAGAARTRHGPAERRRRRRRDRVEDDRLRRERPRGPGRAASCPAGDGLGAVGAVERPRQGRGGRRVREVRTPCRATV